MAELKTKPTEADVQNFLNGVADERKRADCFVLRDLMQNITKEKPKMWGGSIVGFGSYHYKYDSGREGDWFVAGFAPRKQALTLYIMAGFSRYDELLGKLGKHTHGKSCLYIKKLDDVDLGVLRELVEESVAYVSSI